MKIHKKQLNSTSACPPVGQGYTLIEVVIAMTITSIAFIAIYALFAKSMQADAESRYEIVGAALAQEGIEIIKNKREKNEMDWAMWNRADDSAIPPGPFVDIEPSDINGCNPELDLSNPSVYGFSCGVNNEMQYNKGAASQKYEANCGGGADCVGPIFERSCESASVATNPDGSVSSLQIICEVKWDSLLIGGGTRSAKTEIVLTDWQR